MENKNKEEKRDDGFELRAYDKVELAQLYCPGRTPEAAGKTLWRWMKKCQPLMDALREDGYDSSRHRFLKKEVRLITSFLGEP